MTFGPIVSPEWLHEHINDEDVRVIDFRWYLICLLYTSPSPRD